MSFQNPDRVDVSKSAQFLSQRFNDTVNDDARCAYDEVKGVVLNLEKNLRSLETYRTVLRYSFDYLRFLSLGG